MKIHRAPYTGGMPYQHETLKASISQDQPKDCIQYVFHTGGNQRTSEFHVQITKDDFEPLISRMLEISPVATCDAFNKALKAKLRKRKSDK